MRWKSNSINYKSLTKGINHGLKFVKLSLSGFTWRASHKNISRQIYILELKNNTSWYRCCSSFLCYSPLLQTQNVTSTGSLRNGGNGIHNIIFEFAKRFEDKRVRIKCNNNPWLFCELHILVRIHGLEVSHNYLLTLVIMTHIKYDYEKSI